MVQFNKAFNITMKHEGGLADVKGDKGGLTKFGISQKRYPNVDIRALTLNDAYALYKRDYWYKFNFDMLNNQKIANLAFDLVVLHGRGVKLLQLGLNDSGMNVSVDNAMGPQTLSALNSVTPKPFINNVVRRRKIYMKELVRRDSDNAQFLAGWLKRADSFKVELSMLMLGLGASALAWYYFKNRKK